MAIDSREDCYYFLYGGCNKGPYCSFRHVEEAKTGDAVCIDWIQTKVCKTDGCKAKHSIHHLSGVQTTQADKSTIQCYWEQNGGCKKTSCPFKHNLPKQNINNVYIRPGYQPPVPKNVQISENPATNIPISPSSAKSWLPNPAAKVFTPKSGSSNGKDGLTENAGTHNGTASNNILFSKSGASNGAATNNIPLANSGVHKAFATNQNPLVNGVAHKNVFTIVNPFNKGDVHKLTTLGNGHKGEISFLSKETLDKQVLTNDSINRRNKGDLVGKDRITVNNKNGGGQNIIGMKNKPAHPRNINERISNMKDSKGSKVNTHNIERVKSTPNAKSKSPEDDSFDKIKVKTLSEILKEKREKKAAEAAAAVATNSNHGQEGEILKVTDTNKNISQDSIVKKVDETTIPINKTDALFETIKMTSEIANNENNTIANINVPVPSNPTEKRSREVAPEASEDPDVTVKKPKASDSVLRVEDVLKGNVELEFDDDLDLDFDLDNIDDLLDPNVDLDDLGLNFDETDDLGL